jgi:hypothetical protein
MFTFLRVFAGLKLSSVSYSQESIRDGVLASAKNLNL